MLNNLIHPRKKAIAYYRHSAEDKQENSVTIQRQLTEKFADENDIEIIHEEADEGKSGLSAARPGFEKLFEEWIDNPAAPAFDYILVFDVSRWGRFQDQDEAGHYSFRCKTKGKELIYVSRGFSKNSNPLSSNLEISLHRYMAGEYSRQLSEKVFYGSVKVSEQGYSAGGTAVYGMARQLLDVNKKPIRILKIGEHKQIANERVTFTPINDKTTETVKEIFRLFVNEKYQIHKIISYLNDKQIPSANGNIWDRAKILKILTDETYIGTRIYNKTWGRLKEKSRANPRSEWVIVPKAFQGIVDENQFVAAKERLYWLFPCNYKRGEYAIKRAKKHIENNILQWLLNKGLDTFEAEMIIAKLPIIYAIRLETKDLNQWCFLISEKLRKFEYVLAVSVTPKQKNFIDDFFKFSIQDFTRTDYLILTKNSPRYHDSKIANEMVEETLNLLIKNSKHF